MTTDEYSDRDSRILAYVTWLAPFTRPIDVRDHPDPQPKKKSKRQQMLDEL